MKLIKEPDIKTFYQENYGVFFNTCRQCFIFFPDINNIMIILEKVENTGKPKEKKRKAPKSP